MSDVSKFGPLGEGDSSQPLTVDLTRIDIRRGALNLPRRFYGALPEGELEASDTVAGRKVKVTFRPPRQLEGLAPFFEEHDLRPNDGVTIALSGGLNLTPIRRERRQAQPSGHAASLQREHDRPRWSDETPPERPAAAWEPVQAEGFVRELPRREHHAEDRLASERPASEHRSAEGRAAEQRAAEQRAAEQRAAEQRAAEQRAAEQRAAEQRAAEQRAAEQRAAEQRAAEQRAAEDRAAEDRTRETIRQTLREELVREADSPPSVTNPKPETARGYSADRSAQSSGERGQRPEERSDPPRPKAFLAPPVPEIKGGWQNVLHDPTPRRGQAPRSPDGQAKGEVADEARADGSRQRASEQAIDVGSGEKWHQAPRDLSRSGLQPQGGKDGGRGEAADARAARPASRGEQRAGSRTGASEENASSRQEFEQQGLFDGRLQQDDRPRQVTARHQPVSNEAPQPLRPEQPPARPEQSTGRAEQKRETTRTPDPRPETERETVLVGASGAADVAGSIARYLADPGTPAIIRATGVAEALGLPLEAVRSGLAEASRKSEGSVTPIRTDVYLVKRSR